MIRSIIDMLVSDDWLVGDEDIDFAKGKYALPNNWKEVRARHKRWRQKG